MSQTDKAEMLCDCSGFLGRTDCFWLLSSYSLNLFLNRGWCLETSVAELSLLKTVIHWFRRDLRVSDNTALHAAWMQSDRLIPFFCWDDTLLTAPDACPVRIAFVLRSLESLSKNLAALGHRLIIRYGRSDVELVRLCRETGAVAVYANKDYEPEARQVDQGVALALGSVSAVFHCLKDQVIHQDREVLTKMGGVFTVFTPYSKAWKALPVPSPVPCIGGVRSPVTETLVSFPVPAIPESLGVSLTQASSSGGERAARQLLDVFLEGRVFNYATGRDFPLVQLLVCKSLGHQRFRPYGRDSPVFWGCRCPAKAEIWKVLTKTSNSIS
ncbi:MAG: deoxyribodipyrimidine photo-lyase, partial [Pedosphaera sp.]|nr:deoxyribodipyrimidine photo-lyase [Pedosphaera sp.]